MSLKTKYEYIHFEKEIMPASKKTLVYSCRNNRSGDELGYVKWYSPWRQYCFFPDEMVVFNVGCLNDVVDFIGQLRGQREAKKK